MTTGTKRARLTADEPYSFQGPPSLTSSTTSLSFSTTSAPHSNSTSNSSSNASSSFRNVSACNRCRLRKNRCDQNLPACTSCEKAGVKCVGFDPITKREIPRTYVYYLESRVRYLEELLVENHVTFAPSHDFDLGSVPVTDPTSGHSPKSDRVNTTNHVTKRERANTGSDSGSEWEQKQDESDKLHKLVSNIGMVSVQGASDPRFLGSTSGISFARVVFAAVKSAIPGGSARGSRPGSIGSAGATNSTSMRDSFFGLQTKPNIKPAPFPDRDLGLRLVNLYFEHANPQIPILHRPEFMVLFGRAYAAKDRRRSSRELYMLNIVFAIGAGTILEDSKSKRSASPGFSGPIDVKHEPASPTPRKQKSSQQRQPEEYYASAMVHLESFLGSMTASPDRPEGLGGGLEQLQAVLLLASFALLRPVAPGLWYITGVAVRLGVDLGLHYEDGAGVDSAADGTSLAMSQYAVRGDADDLSDNAAVGIAPKEWGRKEYVRDLRRRLWWCVYSFDRLPFADNFHAWRKDIDRRLWEWKETAPLQQDTSVNFSVKFLELNYWQAVIMLYRQSLSVPPDLARESGPHNEVESPLTPNADEDHEHEDDIFLKVAEAGQRVLKLYRQLHRVHLVNYTYLATVHLFMADLTVLAATSVLTDLIDKCPPAEACRDAFERMAKATIKMCLSTTGFGSQVKFSKHQQEESPIIPHHFERQIPPPPGLSSVPSRPPPQFDYNLKDLFPDTLVDARGSRNGMAQWQSSTQPNFFANNQRPSFSFSDTTNSSSTASIPTSIPQQQYDPSLMTQPPATMNMTTPNYDIYDFDFLMHNDNGSTNNSFTGDSGLDLGFGTNHDWGDGGNQQLPDLFGGFFFGGPQADGTMVMPEEGFATAGFGNGSNENGWQE
ncbi:hypothetical protein P7C71_g5771, partial [Lecanoromycetidae sp. Uapishka_2]